MDNLGKTSLGLDENVAGALSYLLGWVTGIAMLIMERENRYVRFHAFQSTLVFGALCVIWVLGTAIPIFGWIVSFLIIPPVSVLVWLLMLFKAYQGERYKLPVAGDIAEQRA
jgi:uncharacterized membrane protein